MKDLPIGPTGLFRAQAYPNLFRSGIQEPLPARFPEHEAEDPAIPH
jgi:hypothetical protein